jgi:hypothetical protein
MINEFEKHCVRYSLLSRMCGYSLAHPVKYFEILHIQNTDMVEPPETTCKLKFGNEDNLRTKLSSIKYSILF